MWGPGARTPETAVSQQQYTIMWARGPRTPRNPGRSTNMHTCVGPGNPARQGPREVSKYTQLCGAWDPRTPGTRGGQQIYTIYKYIHIYIYKCIHVCMCEFACMYCMYVCMYVCACMCVYVYVCTYVCMHVCMYIQMYTLILEDLPYLTP